MLPGQPPDPHQTRLRQVTRALRLVSISVAFGVLSGTVSVITGLRGHSLAVFGVGLGVLADVTGSAVLIWRFQAERHQSGESSAREVRASRPDGHVAWAGDPADPGLPGRLTTWFGPPTVV